MECHNVMVSIAFCAAASAAWLSLATCANGQDVPASEPFNFEEATRDVPKPREIWPLVKEHTVPPEFKVLSDEVVDSDTDPSQKLRKVTAHFYSQELAGKKWGHPCVIFMPADERRNQAPKRRGKVVIVGSPGRDYFPIHVDKYGDRIAARTGYPTMVLSNPGRYDDGSDIERDIRILSKLSRQTGKNYYNMNCQLAVVYIMAMNVFQEFLGLDELHAVVGGHSKRGRSATVAAAIDPRVASAIIMGNEGVHRTDVVQPHLSFHHAFFQEQVNVPVFYLGATNEDGYRMFNVNIMQERLKQPMTVEMIPNYCHSNFSEIQFMDFTMWVAHVFDNRPVTRISDVTHERQENRTVFRAKIESDARVQMVRAWYVYTDDPAWRDLMWYHLLMRPGKDDYYEAWLHGKMPDAFMVEVGDTAMGIPGYVSSTPQKLTDAPVMERVSRGSLPRLWSPDDKPKRPDNKEARAMSDTGFGDQLAGLTRPIQARPCRASSGLFDPESNRDCHHLTAGQRFLLADLEGPGEVRHIWFTIASRDRRYPRKLVLRIYYDDSKTPSVESPIGDFFAAGNGMRANISSIPIETSSYGRALNCYWRMPFRKRCRIEVHNQSHARTALYFQCDWLKLDSLPDDAYYFHARYRQEYPAKPLSWYTIFEGKGEGQYVGTVFSSQNTVGSWFGEADDRYYVDGEEIPSLIGTGTEDYFNDAWNLRLTSNLRVGTTICETKGDERRITAYRWHVDDPVPFKKSLKVEIERRSFIYVDDPETGRRVSYDFKYRPDYCSSVAYWYQKGVAEPLWPFPPVEERVLPEVWIEPSLIVSKVRTSPGLEPRRASNRTCNLKKFFYMRNDEVGAWVEFPITLPQDGRYAVTVFQNLYKEHGIWKVSLRGAEGEVTLHPRLDFWDYLQSRVENWPENFHHGTTIETKVGSHVLRAGDYWVRFECVGANPLTQHPETGEFGKGRSIGLDAICFRRMPITDPHAWMQEYLKQEEAAFSEWKRTAAETVQAIAAGVTAFRQENGRYPNDLAELAASRHWTGDRIPLDPWHQHYRYRAPGCVRPWSFDVWSVHGNSRKPSVWIGTWKKPFLLKNEVEEGDLLFEGEDLEAKRTADGVAPTAQKIDSYGNAPISGDGLLFLRLNKRGDWAEIQLPGQIPPGRYEVYALAVTSWDYGICQWSLDGKPLGDPFDAHTQTIGMKALPAATVEIGEAAPVLRVEAVGKAERSTGYFAGLDAIVLRPVR